MAKNKGLWADVHRDLEAAQLNCARAVERAKSLKRRGKDVPEDFRFDREQTIGKLLENTYSAMEAAMERLMRETASCRGWTPRRAIP
jgi:hypothetical protein